MRLTGSPALPICIAATLWALGSAVKWAGRLTGLALATLERMDIRPARTAADVEAAAGVLDGPPRADTTEAFLADVRHHLLLAWEDGAVVGMVSGVEMTHPDKGTEMFLYELGVAEEARGRGIGRALTDAQRDLATERGCYAMWVMTELDNVAALRTYEGAGATRLDDSAYLEWRL